MIFSQASALPVAAADIEIRMPECADARPADVDSIARKLREQGVIAPTDQVVCRAPSSSVAGTRGAPMLVNVLPAILLAVCQTKAAMMQAACTSMPERSAREKCQAAEVERRKVASSACK